MDLLQDNPPMKRLIAATLAFSLAGSTSPVQAQQVTVKKMESSLGHAWGACDYIKHTLHCNIDAVQARSDGSTIKGLFLMNCKSKMMNVKNAKVKMPGMDEVTLDGLIHDWYAKPGTELNFVNSTCRNFEVGSGGEDGLFADRYYQLEYTADGRLTCKDTRNNKLRPLQRCRDALKTR